MINREHVFAVGDGSTCGKVCCCCLFVVVVCFSYAAEDLVFVIFPVCFDLLTFCRSQQTALLEPQNQDSFELQLGDVLARVRSVAFIAAGAAPVAIKQRN